MTSSIKTRMNCKSTTRASSNRVAIYHQEKREDEQDSGIEV